MRRAFIDTLTSLAIKNKNIFLLTGDLGFSVFENFKKEIPDRFFNIGVAEANMVGVAAGLALSDKIVFIYSIVPFVTMRCFEQIRNDLCMQKLNVRIIGIGGGLSYGTAGLTHYSIEDIAIMRALPNMTVISPGDPLETELAIKHSMWHQGPIYFRLGKGNDPMVHAGIKKFTIGKGIPIYKGRDLAIIATGNMLYTAKQAADNLKDKKLSVRLISMPTLKPIDKDLIIKAAKETGVLFSIEEHSIIGGLGSAIAEIIAERRLKVCFKRIGLPDLYPKDIGSQSFLRSKYGLTADHIEKTILKTLKG